MTEGKEVPVQEVLGDVRQGLSNDQLMNKYGLSQFQLDFLFRKLIDGGFITQSELDARKPLYSGSPSDGTAIPPQFPLSRSPAPSEVSVPVPGAGDKDSRPPEEALRSYERKAFWGILLSTLLGLVAAGMVQAGDAGKAAGVLINLVSLVVYFWGFYCLVKRKGYHWGWTFLGLLSCIGLLIMLIVKDKYELARSGYMTALIVVIIVIPILMAVIGIILAVSIPYYVSYKRTACDMAARQELSKLQIAYDAYRNDPNNRANEPPRDLGSLVGPYYSWSGTPEKCLVLIKYDRLSQEAEAVAIKGSHPQGATSRYVYRRNLTSGSEQKSTAPAIDSSRFTAYPSSGTSRSSSCFDNAGILIEECRGTQP